MQEVYRTGDNVFRFKANKIVEFLLKLSKNNGVGLHELSSLDFGKEDWLQFYQLIGYSVGGFSDIFPGEDDSELALTIADKLKDGDETYNEDKLRIKMLEENLFEIKSKLKDAAVAAFHVHPDDLMME